jgi:MFS family permease
LIISSKSEDLPKQILAYSLGQIVGALGLGMSRDFISTKQALLLSISFGVLSSLTGILLEFFPLISYFYIVELVKFLAGIWNGGVMAVEQAYVSEVVADIDKLRVLTEIGLFDIVAGALGLILQEITHKFSEMRLVVYSSSELFCAVVTFLFTFSKFQEFTIEKRANRTRSYKDYERPAKFGVFICFIFSAVLYYSKTIQFFMLLNEVEEVRNMQTYINSILEVFLSGLGLYFLIFLHGFIEEEKTILVIFSVICSSGWLFLIDFKSTSGVLYYIGFFTTTTSFAVCRCCIFVILSKIIGPYPAGLYFGAMISIGEVGSILTVFAGYELLYWSSYLVQVICAGSLLVSCGLLVWGWKRCAPHYLNKKYSKLVLNLDVPLLPVRRVPSNPLQNDYSYASARP